MTDRLISPQDLSVLEAWLYLRKSRDELHDPNVLTAHRDLLLRLARQDGVPITAARIFEEIGSGERIETRPEFRRLLGLWERRQDNARGIVYTVEVARLTRGAQSQQGRIQDALIRVGILHRTPYRLYDLWQDDDLNSWEMEGFMSRMELRNFRRRAKIKRDHMLREGQNRNGAHPDCYEWDKASKRYVPNERFNLYRLIAHDALTMSLNQLSAKYGLPVHKIQRTLQSPTICGYPAHYIGSGKRLPREQWVWPVQPGDYEPLLSREAWEALQVAIGSRHRQRAAKGASTGWCRDVVRFIGHEAHPTILGSDYRPLYMVRQRDPYLFVYVPREVVHTYVTPLIPRLLDAPGIIKKAQTAVSASERARQKTVISQGRSLLLAEVSELERKLDAITERELLVTDQFQLASFARVRESLTQSLKQKEIELAAVPEPRAEALDRSTLELLEYARGRWEAIWAEADDWTRRALVNGTLARVWVCPRERRVISHEWRGWVR